MKTAICRILGAIGPGIAIGFCLSVAMDSWVNGLALGVPLTITQLIQLRRQDGSDKIQ